MYIRKFNEDINITDELKEFCNNSLAFLIDEGFSVRCIYTERFYTRISIHKPGTTFNWFDVRDDIIPFMDILSKKYKVSDIKFYCIPLDKVESISDILDDNIDNYEIYGGITLEVRDK
jgi:hypothetical protein